MGELFGTAFGGFDIYSVMMMLFVSVGAAFTMRGIGSIITATIAALTVFATFVFMRSVVSTGLSSGDTTLLVHDEWNDLLTLQFGTLCVYAIVFGTIVIASYGVLSFTRN